MNPFDDSQLPKIDPAATGSRTISCARQGGKDKAKVNSEVACGCGLRFAAPKKELMYLNVIILYVFW